MTYGSALLPATSWAMPFQKTQILQKCDNGYLSIVITYVLASIPREMEGNDSRSVLAEALKQALAGRDSCTHLQASISNPSKLSLLEKSAWLQIQNWAADESLRKQFPDHAEFSRRRVSGLLASLES